MNINSISANSIAASVWTVTTRILSTFLGNNAVVSSRATVGAGLVLDLRPAAAKVREVTIAHVNLPSNTDLAGIYDGTNFDSSGAAMSNSPVYGTAIPAIGLSYKNTSAGSAGLTYVGWDWS